MSGAASPEAEIIIRQQQQINTLMGQSASQIERVQKSLDGAYAAQTRFQQAQNSINSAVERGRLTQDRANELLALNKRRLDDATAAANRLGTANDNVAQRSGNLSHQIGQAGFQVQDFAVQVASGQSALTAFAQQAPQLLGAFGTVGILAGAAVAIGAIVIRLVGAKTAAEALNEALERQNALYQSINDSAQRYRDSQTDEALNAQRLTFYYGSLNSAMREAEQRRLALARVSLEDAQRASVREATSRIGGLSTDTGIVPGMPLAESFMSGIGGAGTLSPGLQAATDAVRQFREQGVFTAQAIDTLQNRLTELAARYADSATAIIRQRTELETARPQLIETQRALDQNAAAAAALAGNVTNAATALGGIGAAAAAQLQPLRDLVRDLDKANAEMAALRSGGIEGLEAQRRSQTIFERARQDRDQDIAERVRRGASPSDARTQADDAMSLAERVDQARRLVEQQRNITDTTDQLEREKREREAEARRAAAAASRGGGRARSSGPDPQALADRLARERDTFLAANDPAERYAQTLRSIDELNTRLTESGQDPLPQETVLRAQETALRAYNQALEQTDRQTNKLAESSKELTGITNGLGDAFSKAFEDLVFEGSNVDDVLKNLERSLIRLGNQYLLNPLFQQGFAALLGGGSGGSAGGTGGGSGGAIVNLIGSLFSSGAGAAGSAAGAAGSAAGAAATATQIYSAASAVGPFVLHDGGIVGAYGTPTRLMPASVFLDAPRYHSGGSAGSMPFANDEVPAILRRGELVLTERQQQAVASRGGPINQTIIVRTDDPGAFNRSRNQIANETRRGLARATRNA